MADQKLKLSGVDHSARPTTQLRQTVEFYRNVMGLPLVHAITARGWGPEGHPDFLHFFFDSGRGSTIAFFYYLEPHPEKMPSTVPQHRQNAFHTAWRVDSRDELVEWKETLEARGIAVSPYTRHEILESIYFSDPNGYPLEIACRLREPAAPDMRDADLTIEAAMALEDQARLNNTHIQTIDDVWRRKADLLLQAAA